MISCLTLCGLLKHVPLELFSKCFNVVRIRTMSCRVLSMFLSLLPFFLWGVKGNLLSHCAQYWHCAAMKLRLLRNQRYTSQHSFARGFINE